MPAEVRIECAIELGKAEGGGTGEAPREAGKELPGSPGAVEICVVQVTNLARVARGIEHEIAREARAVRKHHVIAVQPLEVGAEGNVSMAQVMKQLLADQRVGIEQRVI